MIDTPNPFVVSSNSEKRSKEISQEIQAKVGQNTLEEMNKRLGKPEENKLTRETSILRYGIAIYDELAKEWLYPPNIVLYYHNGIVVRQI